MQQKKKQNNKHKPVVSYSRAGACNSPTHKTLNTFKKNYFNESNTHYS